MINKQKVIMNRDKQKISLWKVNIQNKTLITTKGMKIGKLILVKYHIMKYIAVSYFSKSVCCFINMNVLKT